MTVIVQAQEKEAADLGSTNTSHLNPVRSKFKAFLLNVTRLYPVPAIVPDGTYSSSPDGTHSSSPDGTYSSSPDKTYSSSSDGTYSYIPGLSSSTEQPLNPSSISLISSERELVSSEGTDQPNTAGLSNIDKQSDILSNVDRNSNTKYSNKKQSNHDDRQSGTDTSVEAHWSRIDKALFASESVESREYPSQSSGSSNSEKPSVSIISGHSSTPNSRSVTLGDTELLTDSDASVMSTNQSERLEREIRKNNASQNIDIHLHPSFEPESDGLEHEKLSQHTQEYVRRISTTVTPVTNESKKEPEVKPDTEEGQYTIYVTPPNPYSSTTNDLTTQTISTPTAQPIEVVKKSENLSKIKDKTVAEYKAKFSAKIKEKTTPLKPVIETSSAGVLGVTSPVSTTSIPTTPSGSTQTLENLTSLVPVHTRTNSSRLADYEVLNDSPVSQENVTELAFENTSISAGELPFSGIAINILIFLPRKCVSHVRVRSFVLERFTYFKGISDL